MKNRFKFLTLITFTSAFVAISACSDPVSSEEENPTDSNDSTLVSSLMEISEQSQERISSSEDGTSEPTEISSSQSPTTETVLSFTEFESSGNYALRGQAWIEKSTEGVLSLHFGEDFAISPGPDLFIFLTEEVYNSPGNGKPNGIIWQSTELIGKDESNTTGPLQYSLDGLSESDLSKIQSIRIYCEAFGYILWGGANIP